MPREGGRDRAGKTAKPESPSEYVLEKSLPGNVEAERMILGVILLDNSVINQAIERLKPDDFFLSSHRLIFDKMVRLVEQGRG
ncbi:MAG: DnaB-like helicase N-terminal domain-containing protein, partial [Blastocatellia bacterium]